MSDYQRWLEGEIDDSDLARLQTGKVNHILDGIKTEAGKRLWTEMNNNYGSSVWGPVGDGIVEIEAEVEERIIKLLEKSRKAYLKDPVFAEIAYAFENAIALFKGENK